MARPRTKCCPFPTEPGTGCTQTVTPAGQHPSLTSSRSLRMGNSPATETLAFGCAAQPALTVGAFGRHRFEFPVQATGGPWRAYFVVWFDAPTNLDPSVIGSLSRINWGTQLKVRLAEGWTDADDAQLLTGIVLEQAATKYFTAPNSSNPTLYGFNPCCWQLLQTTAQDEHCAGSEVGWTLGVHRADSAHRSTPDVEHVASNPHRLVGDWFGTLDVDGIPNDDIRPALDLYDTTPVDRVGAVFCLSGSTAGDFRIVAQLGPLCGTVSAHGSYRTAGPINAPSVPGTLIVDEPLDTGVTGGMGTVGGLYMNDDGATSLYGGGVGGWSTRDGQTLYETIGGGLGEYLSGAAWIPYNLPSPPPYNESFQLTAEVTWRRINDQDRRYRFDERPGGLPPTDRLHSQECGLMIAPFGKVTLGHQLAIFEEGQLTSSGLVRVSQALTDRGSLATDYNLHPRAPYGWPCPCDELPDPSFCDGPTGPSLTGTYATNPSVSRILSCLGGAIEDGTRLAMIVKRIPDSQFLSGGCIGDDWLAFRYTVEVWVNGRSLNAAPWFPSFQTLGYTWSTATIHIGLVAHWGGAWSNLKVWHNQ